MNSIKLHNSFGRWSNDIPNNDLDTVINYVLTNHTIQSVPDDSKKLFQLLQYDTNTEYHILDFGCGIGRNTISLSQQRPNWKIIGYDNTNMLRQAERFCIEKYGYFIKDIPNLFLRDDWYVIQSMNFDCVISWLVFQHIYEEYIYQYLDDIKKISKKLIIYSRQFNDEIDKNSKVNKDTFAIIENILGKPEQFILDNNSKHIHGLFIYNFHTSI